MALNVSQESFEAEVADILFQITNSFFSHQPNVLSNADNIITVRTVIHKKLCQSNESMQWKKLDRFLWRAIRRSSA